VLFLLPRASHLAVSIQPYLPLKPAIITVDELPCAVIALVVRDHSFNLFAGILLLACVL
jgi:hypothetical protein